MVEKKFIIGYYTTATGLGGVGYQFLNEEDVIYKWYSDLVSFERKGNYLISNDTVKINFEPIVLISGDNNSESITEFEIRNKENEIIRDFPVKFFKKGDFEIIESDSLGLIKVGGKLETIDSIYFNWGFEDLGIYPMDNKFVPTEQKVDGRVLVGYAKLKVYINEDIIQHPVNSNSTEILIIGENKLFNGLDYDPDAMYLGGVLEFAK